MNSRYALLKGKIKDIIKKYNGESLDNKYLNNIDIGSQDVSKFINDLAHLLRDENADFVDRFLKALPRMKTSDFFRNQFNERVCEFISDEGLNNEKDL